MTSPSQHKAVWNGLCIRVPQLVAPPLMSRMTGSSMVVAQAYAMAVSMPRTRAADHFALTASMRQTPAPTSAVASRSARQRRRENFLFRSSNKALYGGDGFEDQRDFTNRRDDGPRWCCIHSRRSVMDNSPGEEVSAGQSKADTTEVGQNYICGLPKDKEGFGPLNSGSSLYFHRGCFYWEAVPILE